MLYVVDPQTGRICGKRSGPGGPGLEISSTDVVEADTHYWDADTSSFETRSTLNIPDMTAENGELILIDGLPECWVRVRGVLVGHSGGELSIAVPDSLLSVVEFEGKYEGQFSIWLKGLDDWKAHFGAEVDAQHRVIERKVISEGQTIIDRYRRKQIEVPLARAKLEAGQPLDPAETPLIAVAVARIQTVNPSYDPMKKVIEIEQNASSWVPLDVAVEAERDGVKTLIRDATTLAEIEAAFATLAWPI